MPGFTPVFGGDVVVPAQLSYGALSITTDTTLSWPTTTTSVADTVADLMDVTTTAGLSITMPDATQTTVGAQCMMHNVGSNTFTVKDNAGGTIGTVASGIAHYFYLADNSTAAGTWREFTFAAGTSSASAASLVGYGLKAIGATLNQAVVLNEQTAALTITTASRASAYSLIGGSVACTLPAASTAGDDFFFFLKNGGTGTVTITPAGTDTVDGAATVALSPNDACIVMSSGGSGAWYTIGMGRSVSFAFTQLSKSITSAGGVTTDNVLTSTECANKLHKYNGVLLGAVTVSVTATNSVYYVNNNTTGAYGLAVQVVGGAGLSVTVPTAAHMILVCDGTDVYNGITVAVSAGFADLNMNGYNITNLGTINKVTITQPAAAATLTIANNKTFTASNTLTLSGTDGSTLNVGAGGTLGTAAYTAAGAYAASGAATASGLTMATARLLGRTTASTGAIEEITVGTGVLTALGIAIGSAGAPITFNGAGGTPSSMTGTNITGIPPAGVTGTAAILGANTFTGTQILGDQQVTRAMLIDTGMTYVDKGNSSTTTQTLDYTAGHHQKVTATGNHTVATSNWPPTGNLGIILFEATNYGAYTITWPTINWVKPDGTTTTTFATWLAAVTGRTTLQSSGIDWFLFWSRDAGTTIYGGFAK